MKARNIVKNVLGTLGGIGAGVIIGSVVKNNVTSGNFVKNSTVKLATIVLSSIVGNEIQKRINERVDNTFELVDKYKELINSFSSLNSEEIIVEEKTEVE